MLTRDKVRGMLVGGAVGDAWGMPVETWTPEKILEVHPEGVPRYVEAKGHKWFNPAEHPPGTVTDDTQLTIATMMGLIAGRDAADKSGSFDDYMESIAMAHCVALNESDAGWGNTTREAIRRLVNGVSWKLSGKTTEKHRGTGNGVPMKISPLAVWYATECGGNLCDAEQGFNQRCVEYSAMTHYTQMSAQAAVLHAHAVYMCLWSTPQKFYPDDFLDLIGDTVWDWGRGTTESDRADHTYYDVDHLNETEDKLENRMLALLQARDTIRGWDRDTIRELFGNGSCYVYDSLPFTYAFFLKDWSGIQILQQVIEAGGDTDTNAKMVGEMLGALHGLSLFQQPENEWTITGLKCFDELMKLADAFCDTFEID